MNAKRKFLLALAFTASGAAAHAGAPGSPNPGNDTLRAIPHSFSDVLEFTLVPAQAAPVEVQVTPVLAAVRRAGGAARDARDSVEAAPPEAPRPQGWKTWLGVLAAMLFIAWRKLSR